MLFVKLKLFPAVEQFHFDSGAELEVTVLQFFLATIGNNTESFGLGSYLSFPALVDIHILAVPKSPLVLCLFLLIK